MKIFLYVVLLISLLTLNKDPISRTTISADEIELYNLIMEYRNTKGLESISLSNSLTIVAQTHCKDLAKNKPDLKTSCNAHSWSNNDKWSSCCYTSDHKKAECMWDKPKELTSYSGYGFEIAVGSSESAFEHYKMTPEYAIRSWRNSFHHNNVIINKDKWKSIKWNAIGIGIYKGFATVWFGRETDSDGEPEREK